MIAARFALVGAPNSGKSTLFNGLTGGRAKIANYPGVTVETRAGHFVTPAGNFVELVDLPGIYGFSARSRDEHIALDAITGKLAGAAGPDAILLLVDAANLRTHLHTVLQLRALGRPMIVVLNMMDLAQRDGMKFDLTALEHDLGLPVVAAFATRARGREALLRRLDEELLHLKPSETDSSSESNSASLPFLDLKALQREARRIADRAILVEPAMNIFTRRLDGLVLHPVAGPLILAAILFFMFQAVYAWASLPMDMIDSAIVGFGDWLTSRMSDGWFRSLLVDGILAGVGSVVIFLPQIVILFAFILALEASGYMGRTAFMMDALMLRVGLNGRAFIPLLSSFACAIPGMMAARTIESEHDRLTAILVAPLMTCSARLPVYTLIIAAFIPPQKIGPVNLQGLVMFALYLVGVASALLVAFILKRTVTRGRTQPLIMELPTYKLPEPRDFFINLWMRAYAFLRRAGTIIFSVSVILWFLASFPASSDSIRETFAGRLGSLIEPLLRPIGFNLEIAIALVPGMAAREVAVGALGTVYALRGSEEAVSTSLAQTLQTAWSLPTALAFLAWYIFAPQCLSTLAVARRETNSWKWTALMFGYLFVLAYVTAGTTYWAARAAGL